MNKLKVMKSVVGVLLASSMLFSFAACGDSSKDTSSQTTSTNTSSIDGASSEDGGLQTGDLTSSATSSGSTGIPILKPSSSNISSKASSNTPTSSTGHVESGDYDAYANIDHLRGTTVKILLWYTPSADETKVMNDFTAKTGIKVKPIRTDNAKYLSRLSTLVASKDAPDCAALFDDKYPTGVIKGLFDDINKGAFDLKNDPYIDLDTMKYVSWGGKQYGVTYKESPYNDRPMVFFNKTMFKNKGVTDPGTLWKNGKWNWDTFAECAEKMTSTTGSVTTYGLGNTSDTIMQYLLASNNTNFVTLNYDKGTITNNLKDAKVLQAMSFYSNLSAKKLVAPEGNTWELFTAGKCAMYAYGQSWGYTDGSFGKLKDEWTAVPFPSPAGQKHINPVNVLMWGLGKNCKNPEGGSYLVRWLNVSNNDIIKKRFSQETYKAWEANLTAEVCPMWGYGVLGVNLYKELAAVSRGNVNDISTKLAAKSGSVDNAIKTIVNEMQGG